MIYYETMYVLRPDMGEDNTHQQMSRFEQLVKDKQGENVESRIWAKRRLAYEIKKYREGIYVRLTYEGDGSQIAPLERAMRLSEDVIRYLTIKQEEEDAPPVSEEA